MDLGLPSGLKWASFNLGASLPERFGLYYAWGETEPKSNYDWSTYKWCRGSSRSLTKYCSNSSYGYNGFTDTKTVLDPDDDAAYINLGSNWRMPTDTEFTELRENCTWEWTSMNDINGQKVTGPNGNSIFLPATGFWNGMLRYYMGSYGVYWSSTLKSDNPSTAWRIDFGSSSVNRYYDKRYLGRSIRPVCD